MLKEDFSGWLNYGASEKVLNVTGGVTSLCASEKVLACCINWVHSIPDDLFACMQCAQRVQEGTCQNCSLWNSFTLRVSLLHFSPHPPPPFFFPFCFFFYGRKFLLALAETALIDLICTEVIFLLSSQSIKRSCPESSEKELPAAGLVSDAKWLALVQPSLVSSGVVRHSTNSSHISICHRSYLILPYSDTMQKVKW